MQRLAMSRASCFVEKNVQFWQMFVAGVPSMPNHTPHNFSPSMPLNSDGGRQSFVGHIVAAKTTSEWSHGGTIFQAN